MMFSSPSLPLPLTTPPEHADGPPRTSPPGPAARETGAPETGAPETGAPETGAPEADAPEADAPEARVPETDAPPRAVREESARERAVHGASTRETGASDTGGRQTPAPETGAPKPHAPRTGTSEAAASQAIMPAPGGTQAGIPRTARSGTAPMSEEGRRPATRPAPTGPMAAAALSVAGVGPSVPCAGAPASAISEPATSGPVAAAPCAAGATHDAPDAIPSNSADSGPVPSDPAASDPAASHPAAAPPPERRRDDPDAPIVSLRHIDIRYGAHHAIKDVSLDIARGEVVAMVGPSGAGKSTLLRAINMLETPSSGVLHVGDVTFSLDHRLSERDLLALRRSTGMVFQQFNLFPHMTVQTNISLPQMRVLGRTRAEADAVTARLLERVHLADKAQAYPARLSGGQQQRIAIARALALDPKVMLFDEPTSALDPELGLEVLEVMRELAAEGMTMIVVTHEIAFAAEVADRVIVMADGRIIEEGTPDQVIRAPRLPRTQAFFRAILDRH